MLSSLHNVADRTVRSGGPFLFVWFFVVVVVGAVFFLLKFTTRPSSISLATRNKKKRVGARRERERGFDLFRSFLLFFLFHRISLAQLGFLFKMSLIDRLLLGSIELDRIRLRGELRNSLFT